MDDNYCKSVSCLFDLFCESLSEEDILYANLISKISIQIVSERLKRNMSPDQFAKFLNMDASVIYDIECGNHDFSLDDLTHIATCLGLDLNIKLNLGLEEL